MNSAHIIATAMADHLRKSFVDLHVSAHSDYSPQFKKSECTKISSCLISPWRNIDHVTTGSEIANVAEIFINHMYSDQSELAIVACRPRKSPSRPSIPSPLNLHVWVHNNHIIALFASSNKITQISGGHYNIIHEDLLSPDSVTNIEKWSSEIIRSLLDAAT